MDVENSLPGAPPPPPRVTTPPNPNLGISSFLKRTWLTIALFFLCSIAIFGFMYWVYSIANIRYVSVPGQGVKRVNKTEFPWWSIGIIVTAAFWTFSLPGLVFWFRKRVRWEHHLFSNGIAAVATVSHISSHTTSETTHIWYTVHWNYTATGRTTYSCKTPKGNMPRNVKQDDKFWILFDPNARHRALRWNQFAQSGQLIQRD